MLRLRGRWPGRRRREIRRGRASASVAAGPRRHGRYGTRPRTPPARSEQRRARPGDPWRRARKGVQILRTYPSQPLRRHPLRGISTQSRPLPSQVFQRAKQRVQIARALCPGSCWVDLKDDKMINPAPGCWPIFGPLGPTAGPGSLGTGSGSKNSAGCTKDQPRGPLLGPIRGSPGPNIVDVSVSVRPPPSGKPGGTRSFRPPLGRP